jgi:hypothetical protein
MLNSNIATLLRNFGADNYRRQDHDSWALCLAAARGDWTAAVEWGRTAELDWRENPPSDRLTALQYAAVEGHSDIARLLVKAGHSVDLLDNRALSASQLARLRGHHALADYLQELETESHWRRSEELAASQGGEAEDYMPRSMELAEDGQSWQVLKDLLMPHVGEEIKWEEPSMEEVEQFVAVKDLKVDPAHLKVKVISARNLESRFLDTFNLYLDALVRVHIARTPKKVFKTNVVNSDNPMFNQEFDFDKVRKRDVLVFTVWDQDTSVDFGSYLGYAAAPDDTKHGDELLGRLEIHLTEYWPTLYAGKTAQIRKQLDHQLPGQNMMLNLALSCGSKEVETEITAIEAQARAGGQGGGGFL